jgi:ubiquinone biosynthesis protein Coq4
MIEADARRRFEAMATSAGGDARALAAGLRRETTAIGLKALAALLVHAAVSTPERLAQIYDAASEGWRGKKVMARPMAQRGPRPEPIPEAFWTGFWALLETPRGTLGAGGVTQRTAELAALAGPGLRDRLAAVALTYPGVADAARQGYPRRFELSELARCPPDSLGGDFHRLIVENGFDLEVLDREDLGLAGLPPPLDYLNARILQCHDLWHISAGYRTTGLHEVAISGFQLGQFGHAYSALFLATVLTRGAFERTQAAPVLLDTILGGWTHGRESPPLLGVNWEALWDRPVEAIRADLGLTPYVSSWPADMFEQMSAAA